MQPKSQISTVQPGLMSGDKKFREPLSYIRLSAGEHEHQWVFLTHGYEVCAVCGVVRKVPS